MCFVWLWTTELKDLTEGSDVEEEEDGVEKHSHVRPTMILGFPFLLGGGE